MPKLAGFPKLTPAPPTKDSKAEAMRLINSMVQGLHGFGYDPNQVIHGVLPEPGIKGRIFVDPDQNRILLDSGSEWKLVAAGLPAHLTSIPEISPWAASGYLCLSAANATAATTVALTASCTYWYPFVVWKSVSSITLWVNVTTASAGTHYLGVYASDTNGKPTNLLGSGSFAADTAGVKSVTLNITLDPGIYWIAWVAGSAATVRGIAIAGARSFGLTSALGTAHITYWYTSGSTLPDTAPTSGYTAATEAIVPAICVTTI